MFALPLCKCSRQIPAELGEYSQVYLKPRIKSSLALNLSLQVWTQWTSSLLADNLLPWTQIWALTTTLTDGSPLRDFSSVSHLRTLKPDVIGPWPTHCSLEHPSKTRVKLANLWDGKSISHCQVCVCWSSISLNQQLSLPLTTPLKKILNCPGTMWAFHLYPHLLLVH